MSASLALVSRISGLTTKEKEIITAFKGSDVLSASIRDDLSPKELFTWLKACCSLIKRFDTTSTALKAATGCLLHRAAKDKAVLESLGFNKIGELQADLMSKTGIAKSTVYESKKIYDCFPDLTIDDYCQIGTQKLLLLCKCTNQSEAGHKKLLRKAMELTLEELKLWLEEQGYFGKDETTGASFVLTGTRAEIKELRAWFKRPEIIASAESGDPIKMILAATHEVESEWNQGDASEEPPEAA